MGYFPLPLKEAQRIRACLLYPASAFSAIDPCIGDGAAFRTITEASEARRYGIELDAYRAEQASAVVEEIIHGDCLDALCPVESYSVLFLNAPFDWISGEDRSERTERVLLAHTYRWLRPGGVLILVVSADRVKECSHILASQFKETRVYRLTEPEAVRYREVVILATRRNRREYEQLRDDAVARRRAQFASIGYQYEQLAVMNSSAPSYLVPESGPAKLRYRGLLLDEIEDLLPKSAAYHQASRILFAPPKRIGGRPLTPLHAGHVALLAVSSMLDGVLGSGENRHIAAWRCVKVIDRSEEVEEDGTVIQRERERFTNELTLVFPSGKTAILH
jgi:hypothetical protein